jgi:hypothetical protein
VYVDVCVLKKCAHRDVYVSGGFDDDAVVRTAKESVYVVWVWERRKKVKLWR